MLQSLTRNVSMLSVSHRECVCSHQECVVAEGARDAAHAGHHGRAALRAGRGRQVDDPLTVGPRTGDPQTGRPADQQAVARAADVLLTRRGGPHRLAGGARDGSDGSGTDAQVARVDTGRSAAALSYRGDCCTCGWVFVVQSGCLYPAYIQCK